MSPSLRLAIPRSFRLLEDRDRRRYVLLIVGHILVGLVDAGGVALLTAATVAVVRTSGAASPPHGAATLAVTAVALFLAKSAAGIALLRGTWAFLAKRELSMSMHAAEVVFSDPIVTTRRPNTHTLTYALGEGVGYATSRILSSIASAIADISLVAIILSVVVAIQPITGLAMALGIGLVGVVMIRLFSLPMQRASQQYGATVVATSTQVRDICETQRELYSSRRLAVPLEALRDARMDNIRATARQSILAQGPRYCLDILVALGFGGVATFLLTSTSVTSSARALTVLFAALARLLPAVLRLQTSLQTAYSAAGVAEHAYQLFDLVAGGTEPASSSQGTETLTDAGSDHAAVSINKVSYTYPGAQSPALCCVDLVLPKGQLVALIGPSGAGKTTLVEVLLGLRLVQTGDVHLYGQSLTSGQATRGQTVGYMPQTTHLISASLRNNVALGVRPECIDDGTVLVALREAGLGYLTDSLANGLDTVLGDGEHALSGGERQRIGLARILYDKPGLIILDEPTSALDTSNESIIRERMLELRKNSAVLVIAHRLSTISEADSVVALAAGKVVLTGTPSEVVPRYLASYGQPS